MKRLASIARRHRRGHAFVFALAVCLLVASAAVEPLLARSIKDSLIRDYTSAQGAAGRSITLTSNSGSIDQMLQTERAVDPRLRAVVGPPSESLSTLVRSTTSGGVARLEAAYNGCLHVRIVQGRCPLARNEVMMSQTGVAVSGPAFRLGARLPVVGAAEGAAPEDNPHKTMRLVGIFTATPGDPFWTGADLNAYLPAPEPGMPKVVSGYWLTSDLTFAGAPPQGTQSRTQDAQATTSWLGVTSMVSYPMVGARLTSTTLAAAATGVVATRRNLGPDVLLTEPLTEINAETEHDVLQIGQILPFTLAQLGLVLGILLAQVTFFFVLSRRPEAAVLKMRGNGTLGVLGFGALEFLPACLVGLVGGVGLACAVDWAMRHVWLPGGVAFHWSWQSCRVAVLMIGAVAVVWCVCWLQVAREPISSLLRARPVRRGVRLSVPAAVAITGCAGAVVLTATKDLTGAPAQMTPVLLAALVSIAVGMVIAPLARRGVRALLPRRRAAAALSVAHLGRRPGVVAALATLIISAALVTFSASVYARGVDNRAARAAADVGAQAFIYLAPASNQVSGADFIKAIESVDPRHADFAPAVEVDNSVPGETNVLGVLPADMRRIGLRTGLREPVPWSALGNGGRAAQPNALAATWTTPVAVGATVQGPRMDDSDGPYRVVGVAPYIPGVGPHTVVVDLSTLLRQGMGYDSVTFEVYSRTSDPARLAALRRAMVTAGFGGTTVQTLTQARRSLDVTATAWSARLSILVSILALLAALVSVVLVAIASREDRQRDLRALRTGGVSQAVLRRATVLEFVVLAFVGSVVGAMTAPAAAALTGPAMLWWSTPPAQPLTNTGFQWHVGTLSALAVVVCLVLIGAIFGVRMARSTDKSRGAAV